MGWIKGLLIKMFGKKVRGKLDDWGVSKTKLTAVIGVVIYAIDKLGPTFGHPVVIPPDVYNVLGALGLWSLRDGIDANKD